ncbi:hypothetical protein P3TCK_26270 [Photobacterium profundum 3TCK]|uniref:Uncharacterized protein n=1 Tax=Photobacterium profundum 3TCK TaxID=314280 RepID=Q1Z248_9GAMM|nr:hypothetical protein P3TCK_26270 [Photobacterium profundum 3TCK]
MKDDSMAEAEFSATIADYYDYVGLA